jgi:hypothetical protein
MLAVRRLPALLVLVGLACAAPPALAFEKDEPPPPEKQIDWHTRGPQIFDAVVLRPLGAGAALAGAGFFLIAAPLTWYSEGVGAVWDVFVMEPVDFTFRRPLGDF